MNLPRPSICLITDRRRLAPDARTTREGVLALERWLDDAFGEVDLVQIRERDLEGGLLLEVAGRVAARAKGSGTQVVVNDRADVALAAGADGVHVRSNGPATAAVRALGGASWTVGRSVHTVEEVRRESAATYLLFGTLFATTSKGPDVPRQGIEGLTRAAKATTLPVLAIGGINPGHAGQCFAAGAAGIAAIGAFIPGIPAAARAFREAMIG